jgi:hypothetical protein
MSKGYKVAEILDMWDEIPDDGQNTEESSSDEDDVDVDYIQPCDADEPTSGDDVVDDNIEEIDASEASSTAIPKPKKKVAETSTKKNKKTAKKILQKLELVEQFLLKNDHPYPLSADQVKSVQKIVQAKTKEKLSVAQVKMLVEIARRRWKKTRNCQKITHLTFPKAPTWNAFLSAIHQQMCFFSTLTLTLLTTLYFKQTCI